MDSTTSRLNVPHGARIKPWGWAFELGMDRDRVEGSGFKILCRRSLAFVRRGGYSSIHWHQDQTNVFHVVEGRIVVREFERSAEDLKLFLLGESTLNRGDALSLDCGKIHQFVALESTRLVEVYLARPGCDALPDDIHRLSENGCDEDLLLKYV